MTMGTDIFEGSDFRFTIEHVSPEQAFENNEVGYEVYLPHQCDRWSVAWGSRDHAVERLREFIAEAEKALEVLESDQGKDCEYTHSHTRAWCGNVRCREY